MNYPVIIRAESAHRYVAQPLGIPEVKVVAATEAEAIAQVTEALATLACRRQSGPRGGARRSTWQSVAGRLWALGH